MLTNNQDLGWHERPHHCLSCLKACHALATQACLIWLRAFRYGYYLLSAAGVRVPKPVKKAITSMQLVQFGLFFCHALYGALIATHYRPRIIVALCLWQAVVFASLFGQFFW